MGAKVPQKPKDEEEFFFEEEFWKTVPKINFINRSLPWTLQVCFIKELSPINKTVTYRSNLRLKKYQYQLILEGRGIIEDHPPIVDENHLDYLLVKVVPLIRSDDDSKNNICHKKFPMRLGCTSVDKRSSQMIIIYAGNNDWALAKKSVTTTYMKYDNFDVKKWIDCVEQYIRKLEES